jgi:hypothetical protein
MIEKLWNLVNNPKITRIKLLVKDISHQELQELEKVSKHEALTDLFLKRSGSGIAIIATKK